MQLVFKDRWIEQRLTLINSEGIYALGFSFFFTKCSTKESHGKAKRDHIGKSCSLRKIKNEILKYIERKELKCSEKLKEDDQREKN